MPDHDITWRAMLRHRFEDTLSQGGAAIVVQTEIPGGFV